MKSHKYASPLIIRRILMIFTAVLAIAHCLLLAYTTSSWRTLNTVKTFLCELGSLVVGYSILLALLARNIIGKFWDLLADDFLSDWNGTCRSAVYMGCWTAFVLILSAFGIPIVDKTEKITALVGWSIFGAVMGAVFYKLTKFLAVGIVYFIYLSAMVAIHLIRILYIDQCKTFFKGFYSSFTDLVWWILPMTFATFLVVPKPILWSAFGFSAEPMIGLIPMGQTLAFFIRVLTTLILDLAYSK